jgi:hypothetical protein
MRPTMILAAAALGGLLAAFSTSKAHALGYTFTDLNVAVSQPGSTGAFDGLAIANLGQIAGSYIDSSGNFDGSLYMGGKYVTADAPDAIDTSIYGINDPGQLVGTASDSNGSSYDLIATIAILLLLLIAAGSSFAGWKARDVGRYVIGLALLALFLTVGAVCAAIDGFRSLAGIAPSPPLSARNSYFAPPSP